ncbi:hypothetical protein PAXINDRAFT_11931 [Paxillus involutus ATCC 200175]|uniref:DUF6533 domain-containing protein n=1 Tax=Paxillus involutus ATCC 200175 TaxID=664439 RepID=A0A0C9U7H6_PAXIN|nr:hypothetical protein PAXINDRAFT_11931 [Paxillus involutus ATCC 200175]
MMREGFIYPVGGSDSSYNPPLAFTAKLSSPKRSRLMPSGHLSADAPLHSGWQLQINTVVTTVSFAILIYDYVLTFEREVRLFWQRPWPRLSWAFALFVANRYITLMVHVANVVETFWIVSPPSGDAELVPIAKPFD